MTMVDGLPKELVERDIERLSVDDTSDGSIEKALATATYRTPGSSATVVDASQWYLNSPEYAAQQERERVEAAEASRQASIDDEVLKIMDAGPPGAEVLGANVAGCEPARAALIRYVAWRDKLRRQRDELETGRAALLAAIGSPTVTHSKIDALVSKDTTGLLAWLRRGGKALDKPQIRSFERERLEETLKEDNHASEIARAALDQAEFELEVLNRQVAAVEGRHEQFARKAMIEAAAPLASEYCRIIARLTEILTELLALNAVAGRSRPATVEVILPNLGLLKTPTKVAVSDDEIRRVAARMRIKERLIMDDPLADFV